MRILFKDEESTILGRGGDGGGDGGGGTDAAGAPTGSAQAACNFGTDSQQAAYGGDQAVAGLMCNIFGVFCDPPAHITSPNLTIGIRG
jgi:hypothetical protein